MKGMKMKDTDMITSVISEHILDFESSIHGIDREDISSDYVYCTNHTCRIHRQNMMWAYMLGLAIGAQDA